MGVSVKKPEDLDPSSKRQEHAFISKKFSNEDLSVNYDECYNCGDKAQSRMRCFSEKAWSVLLLWKEINTNTVEKPICDYCYTELRTILMERIEEFDDAVSEKSKNLEV